MGIDGDGEVAMVQGQMELIKHINPLLSLEDAEITISTQAADGKASANRVAADVRHARQPRRPWAIVDHGDLWEIYVACLRAKGWRAVRLAKVKAHAGMLHVHAWACVCIYMRGGVCMEVSMEVSMEVG